MPRYSKTDNFKVREGAVLPGCAVVSAHGPDGASYSASGGAVTVPVTVSRNVTRNVTYFVDVSCAA